MTHYIKVLGEEYQIVNKLTIPMYYAGSTFENGVKYELWKSTFTDKKYALPILT